MSPSSTSSGGPVSNALGTIGGGLLSVCLAPQLWRIYKTRSTTDISLYYTLTYTAGLAFNLAYLVLENALVGWIFITLELALALAVVTAKLWLERGGRGKREVEAKRKCAEGMMEEERRREEKENAAAAAAAAREAADERTETRV